MSNRETMGQQLPTGVSTRLNGAPTESDAHSLTVGNDGPIVLHDVHLVEQLAHFNRERVAERSPHAKGSGAFGTFTVTGDVTAYTKAAPFQPGVETPCWRVSPRSPVSRARPTPGATFAASRSAGTRARATSTSSATTLRSSSCAIR